MNSDEKKSKPKITYFERVKSSLQKQFNKKLLLLSIDLTELVDIYQNDIEKSSSQFEKAVCRCRLMAAEDIIERIKWHIPDFKLGSKRTR